MTDTPEFYERALRRIDRIALILAVCAATALFFREGWRGGLGAGAGAAAAFLNLQMWKRVARSVDPSASPSTAGSAALAGLRYLLLGTGIFVIIKYLGVSLLAVFLGLLTGVAAALVEMLYQLISASRIN